MERAGPRRGRRQSSLAMRVGTLLASGLSTLATLAIGTGRAAPQLPPATPPSTLPVLAEHHYQVNGRVRLLLFLWAGRDAVGRARLVWRGDPHASAVELLIGTDPDRAPRRLNRWGYLTEIVRGAETAIVGVMTESNERTLDEAKARLANEADRTVTTLKAIQSLVTEEEALASVTEVRLPGRLTAADLSTALDAIDRATNRGPLKRQALPRGTCPGFLAAAAELVRASVARVRTNHPPNDPPLAVLFVYNATLYELVLRTADVVDPFTLNGQVYRRVVRGHFVVRQRASGRTTPFTMVYGTDGPLAEVPIQVVFQPRWWLQVELVHVEATSSGMARRPAHGRRLLRGFPGLEVQDRDALRGEELPETRRRPRQQREGPVMHRHHLLDAEPFRRFSGRLRAHGEVVADREKRDLGAVEFADQPHVAEERRVAGEVHLEAAVEPEHVPHRLAQVDRAPILHETATVIRVHHRHVNPGDALRAAFVHGADVLDSLLLEPGAQLEDAHDGRPGRPGHGHQVADVIEMPVGGQDEIGFVDFLVLRRTRRVLRQPRVQHEALAARRGQQERSVPQPRDRQCPGCCRHRIPLSARPTSIGRRVAHSTAARGSAAGSPRRRGSALG